MKRIIYSLLFGAAVFVLSLGFFQSQEALAIGPCNPVCYNKGVCVPSSARCYDDNWHLVTCAFYCDIQ